MDLQLINDNIKLYYNHGLDSVKLFYIIGHNENSEALINSIENENLPSNLAFAFINVENWNHDLSPWKAAKVFKQGEDFTGGAETYLNKLTEDTIPTVEKELPNITDRIICGYSLAGLFAVWSIYKTDLFSSVISCSGSMWFDGFTGFCKEHSPLNKIKSVYLSLGDKEKKARNPRMAKVEEDTETIKTILSSLTENIVFELNPGNHFVDSEKRLIKGIVYTAAKI